MIHLHSPQQLCPEFSSYIGIGIQGNASQRHIGILFRNNKEDKPKLLHLAFHLRLKCDSYEKFNNDYFWLICPNLDDDEQLQLASHVKSVFDKNQNRIPYGLAYSSIGSFDSDGTLIENSKNLGLTCATFVMALFNDFGFPIIDTDSWELRADDTIWQNHIINCMKDDRKTHPQIYSETHIDEQIKNTG